MGARAWWLVGMVSLAIGGCGGSDVSDDGSSSPPSAESEVVKGKDSMKKSPTLGIELRQDDRPVAFARGVEGKIDVAKVALQPGAFVLRFPKEKDGVAIQITAWTDSSIFNAATGSSASAHGSFGDARGIAGSGDGTLYLDKEGNNYLVDDRLVSVGNQNDEVSFAKTFIGGASKSLTDQKRDLFLAVFIDKNQNRQFDAGEVEYLILEY